jgi:hypothetical protein
MEAKPVNGTALSPGHPPSTGLDLSKNHQEPSHNNPTSIQQDYPDSEIDTSDWDELEASSPIETFQPIQPLTIQPSTGDVEGTILDLEHIGPLDHETDPPNNMCPFPFHSMLQRMASVPDQSFPEPWQPVIGAPATVYTGGEAIISPWTNPLKPSAISLKLFQPRKTTWGYYRNGDRSAKDGNSTSTHTRDPRATGSAILGLSSKIYGCPYTDGQLPWYGMKTSNQ